MPETINPAKRAKTKHSKADQSREQFYSWTLIAGLILSAISIVIVFG